MCQYHYSYYATCHHQETVLVKYCDLVAPYPPGPNGKQNKRDKSLWRGRRQERRRTEQQQALLQEPDLPSEPPLESLPTWSSPYSGPEYTKTSSPSIGSPTTVTDEPYSEIFSSITEQHHSHSSLAAPAEDMAGLTPFGGIETLRTWMAGSTSKQVQREYAAPSPAMSPTRVREPGIRMNTDESCELHNGSDILQHLAESSCNLGIVSGHSDTARHTSYASDNLGNFPKPRDSFGSIEAEVDALKEMVERLKEDRERVLAEDKPALAADEEQAALGAHCPKTCSAIANLSPAERLQLQHALEASNPRKPVTEPQAPAPPGAMDFPFLGTSGTGSATPLRGPPLPSRKLSYATAASSSIKVAASPVKLSTRVKRIDSKIPGPVVLPAPPRAAEQDVEDDQSVIVSPRVAHVQGMATNASAASPNGPPGKHAPHFAQSTKSFARRASETLRRESNDIASKPLVEVSPTKSVRSKAPDLNTEKRAQHHKRKSLPDGWASVISSQPDAGKPEVTSATSSTATTFTSPTSDGDWQLITSETAAQAANASEAGTHQHSPRLHKKISTYMSPTAATTQRTIATLSEEPVKRGISRVKSAAALKLDIERARIFGNQPSPGSIISSSSARSRFSVEQLSFSTGLSAKSPPEVGLQSPDCGYARSSAGNFGHQYHASHLRGTPLEKRQATLQKANKKATAGDTSRIPRARSNTVQPTSEAYSPTGKFVTSAAHTSSPSFLTSVANTVTRRRTSHADILKPIFDKLESHGLRKENPEVAAAKKAQEVRQVSAKGAARIAREQLRKRDNEASAALSDIALLARQGNAGERFVVPAPRQPGSGDAASTVAEPESDTLALPMLQPASSTPTQRVAADVAALQADSSIIHLIRTASAAHSRSSSVPAQESAPSSLRATARTFKPLWKPENPVQELSQLSWQGMLDCYSDEEWTAIPEDVRRSILTLRQFKSVSGSNGASPSRSVSPSKRHEQRFWGQLLQSQSSISAAEVTGTMNSRSAESSGDMSSPPGVQPGQLCQESLDQAKKAVTWTVQEKNDISRGPGALAAPAEQLDHYATPSISPTSDDTSPVKTPHSARAWTIGAGYSTRPYGWKGGDGREISFSGYGPQAEFNAASPVEMEFHARPPFSPVQEQYETVKRTEYRCPAPKVWPRSQKQWAEYAGYGLVRPCGNMEIVSAVEQIPLGSEMMGLCNGCAPSGVY
ncbi:hypothetical protein LTR91_018626 [Friedmanniomyces endolithicus]|uniref:Uncharacterized protein n=1 Tax=Friedmanniomyces endolithicus TaxID=329885 RepID=A0AAN6K2R3_9PEZI|nr:hypothetical protein LTR35_011546 [Friedmanniomyces endolithicus]KAK0288348.1 hypothetical protein LTS00_009558 [Friedmanniomyces endolithicus]KAK0921390.1 hypothetical protein LTR57_008846 [Friedmanniomyces endolithicus]KAK0958925.1 hypothetical protein LTS01_021638 [Friedmanniomyces endolithicus]KAK0964178.1 hypothetical protein LTR91_018626 [Friedmanniomyces endolithicus]